MSKTEPKTQSVWTGTFRICLPAKTPREEVAASDDVGAVLKRIKMDLPGASVELVREGRSKRAVDPLESLDVPGAR